jgi:hypothetical protein
LQKESGLPFFLIEIFRKLKKWAYICTRFEREQSLVKTIAKIAYRQRRE